MLVTVAIPASRGSAAGIGALVQDDLGQVGHVPIDRGQWLLKPLLNWQFIGVFR